MSTMLDLTKNRYSSQWRAENAGERFGFVSQKAKNPDVDWFFDWDIDFDSEQKAKDYIERVAPRVKEKLEKQKPTGLTTTGELNDFKQKIKDAVNLVKTAKIVKK
jgi:hypothetical protein